MEIDVFLTPDAVADRHVKDRTVVVIDVLRACSTIVTALSNGARGILPVPDMEAASRLAMNRNAEQVLLGGERHGVKIDGFDLGNSPLEYSSETVEERTIIFKTTNGTGAILKGIGARSLVIGSFLNAEAVVRFAATKADDLTIICSGWRGLTSYEDTLCAGLFVDRLLEVIGPVELPDTTRIAHVVFENARDDLQRALSSSDHARRLVEMGHEEDVAFCARTNVFDALPVFEEQMVQLHPAPTTD